MSDDSKQLKVVYLLDSFPALSETFILNEIIELKNQGMDVSVFSISRPDKGIFHGEAEEPADETYYMDGIKHISKLRKFFVYLRAHCYFLIAAPIKYINACRFAYSIGRFNYLLTRFKRSAYYAYELRNSKANHIHAHFASVASEYAMLVSLLSGVSYSFTLHAYDLFQKFSLMREKIELAKFVVAISSTNKNYIKNKCPEVDEDKIHVVHCGVNLKRLSAMRSVGTSHVGREFLILSVGRLIEKKGHRHLLDACKTIHERGISDFTCEIVGDGPLKKELEEQALRLGLSDKVRFTGSLPSEEVLRIVKETDLFVLPCIIAKDGDMDGIPVSLMEAMALGKPVISTNISGIPELVRDGSGILAPPGHSLALADAIEEIYKMELQERERLGKRGREIIDGEFNIEKEVEKLKTLFIGYSKQPTKSQLAKN